VLALDRAGVLPTGWETHADVLLTTVEAPPAPWVGVAFNAWDTTLSAIEHTVTRNPLAATLLVQVLHAAQGQTFNHALVIESLAYSSLLAGPEFARWRGERAAKMPDATKAGGVLVNRQHNTLVVTLSRTAVRNALSAHMRSELAAALQLVDADPTIDQVELRGEGVSFCSGGDLDEFGSAPDPVSAHLIRMAQSACRLLDPNRDRVKVFVQGACIGAGIEIAACARHVIATEDAWFRLPEVAMGLIPGAGGTASITRRIGRHRLAFMALSGLSIDCAIALQWGLIDEIKHAKHVP